MSVVIKLAPIETLGRRIQYAFLSYAIYRGVGFNSNYYLTNEAIFNENDFKNLVGEVKDVVRRAFVRREGKDTCSSQFDGGPKLYVGGRDDRRTLSGLGLEMCGQTTWTMAALSYADRVISNSAGNQEVDLVRLATATLFSEKNIRGPIYVRRKVHMKVNFHGLGILLLGGLLAYLGRHTLQQPYEFFLLPDSPSRAFINLRNIAFATLENNIAYQVRWLATNLAGISFEAALSLAMAIRLAEEAKPAEYLENDGSISSSKLYLISPQGHRPLLIQATPLDLTIAKTYSSNTINYMYEIARRLAALRGQDFNKRQAISAISDCVNFLNLQAMSPCWSEFLAECLREIEQVDAERLGIAYHQKKFKTSLYNDYENMVKKC